MQQTPLLSFRLGNVNGCKSTQMSKMISNFVVQWDSYDRIEHYTSNHKTVVKYCQEELGGTICVSTTFQQRYSFLPNEISYSHFILTSQVLHSCLGLNGEKGSQAYIEDKRKDEYQQKHHEEVESHFMEPTLWSWWMMTCTQNTLHGGALSVYLHGQN